MAQAIVDVSDLCYQYHIDVNDKQFDADVNRLCQYAMLTRVIQWISNREHYVMFVETGPVSRSLKGPFLRFMMISYRSISKAIGHRFIECVQCIVPKQPTMISQLIGDLKDIVLLTTYNTNTNLSKIKKFITNNRLTDIESQIGKSVTLTKILLFS